MKKLKTLVDKSGVYPRNGICPVCKKKLNGNFVTFCSGALLKLDKDRAVMDGEKITCFGHFSIHLDDMKVYKSYHLADDTAIGQYEIYVCSTDCMKKLFCDMLDGLETKEMKRLKKKMPLVHMHDNMLIDGNGSITENGRLGRVRTPMYINRKKKKK